MGKKSIQKKKIYPSFLEYLKAEYQGPYSATDLLIEFKEKGKEGLVLIERKFPPYGIAVPGGIAERTILPANAAKEGREETGLRIKIIDPLYRPFCVLSDVNQDPRAFISALVYRAKGFGRLKPDKDEDAKRAVVYSLDEIADMLELPVLRNGENSNRGWAFPHHRTELALYLLQSSYGLNAKRYAIVKKIYDEYIKTQEEQVKLMESSLKERFGN